MKKIYLLSILSMFTLNLYCQTLWTKYPGNPVMTPDSAGYDRDFVGLGSVIYHDNIYHMWYSGGNWAHLRIGHATSPDGITWTRDTIPVLDYGPTGSWDEDAAFAPQVIVISDMFHMWYVGHRGVANNYDFQIGHATSPDGITWTKDPNNPVLPRGSVGAWDYAWVHTGSVLYDSTQYHLWYSAWDGANGVRMGHATSPDGLTWTKDPSNPVLTIGTVGNWDYPRVEIPSVVFDDTIYHMWYSGGDYFLMKIGYATSKDGSKWTKSPFNPVMSRGGSGTWDSRSILTMSVMDSSGVKYKMWYGGSKTEGTGSIGYAEAIPDRYLPPQPSSISGNSITCAEATETYSVINEPGVKYSWKVTGGTVSGIDTSNSINIIWNTAGNKYITVTPSNSYGSGRTRSLPVLVKSVPSRPSTISGITTVCTEETKTYTVTNKPGVTYSWTITGGSISGNDTTYRVFVTWDLAGDQTITVKPLNSCGAGTERQLEVTVNSKPSPDTITGEINPVIDDTCNYAIPQVSGALSYNWEVSGGSKINDYGDTVTVVWKSSGNQTISVSVRNNCGTGDKYNLNVNVITDVFNIQSGNMISVYPNPAADIINIEISNTDEEETIIELLTVSGQLIYRKEYKNNMDPFIKQIDLSGYAKGVYFVRIRQSGAVYNGKIIVM
jgi:hypothetical protein